MDKEEASDKNEICKDCVNWKEFSAGCWFHWDDKKECSQFRNSFAEDTKLKSSKKRIEEIDVTHILR